MLSCSLLYSSSIFCLLFFVYYFLSPDSIILLSYFFFFLMDASNLLEIFFFFSYLSPNHLPLLITPFIAGLKSWNQPKTTGRPPTARHGHAMVLGDKKMYLFGGKGASYFNDLYVMNCATLAWQKPRITGFFFFLFSFFEARTLFLTIIFFRGSSYDAF